MARDLSQRSRGILLEEKVTGADSSRQVGWQNGCGATLGFA